MRRSLLNASKKIDREGKRERRVSPFVLRAGRQRRRRRGDRVRVGRRVAFFLHGIEKMFSRAGLQQRRKRLISARRRRARRRTAPAVLRWLRIERSVGRRRRVVLKDFLHGRLLTVSVQTETVRRRSFVARHVHQRPGATLVHDHQFHQMLIVLRFRSAGEFVVEEGRRSLFVQAKQRRGFFTDLIVIR